MRSIVGLLAVLTACTFDTSVVSSVGTGGNGEGAADAAIGAADSRTADASVADAALSPDADLPDAAIPDILYALKTTGNANVVAAFGGDGGGDFDEDCPDGRAITGFEGDDTTGGICRLRAICSLATANPDGTVVTSDPQPTARHGNSGSFFQEAPLNCPANQIVVGANGRSSSNDNIVEQLRISCAPLSWNFATTTYSIGAATQVAGDIGTNIGTAASGTCGTNEVAGGYGGSAGTLLDSFELHCFTLAATPL